MDNIVSFRTWLMDTGLVCYSLVYKTPVRGGSTGRLAHSVLSFTASHGQELVNGSQFWLIVPGLAHWVVSLAGYVVVHSGWVSAVQEPQWHRPLDQFYGAVLVPIISWCFRPSFQCFLHIRNLKMHPSNKLEDEFCSHDSSSAPHPPF